jgi:pimeloyl-ACP methyl ester carboxylesterase
MRDWLVAEFRHQPEPVVLGGHSMGAALAMLAAAAVPDRVAGLVLIAPAGLPLTKPISQSLRDSLRQLREGRHRTRDVLESLWDLVSVPVTSIRLVRTLRRLDLSHTMDAIRSTGIPVALIGCTSDTLVPPRLTRTMSGLLGARYRELDSVARCRRRLLLPRMSSCP